MGTSPKSPKLTSTPTWNLSSAEVINIRIDRGTATLTLKMNPSRFIDLNISTEICEDLLGRIAFSSMYDSRSIVRQVEPLLFYGAGMDPRTAFQAF